MVEQTLQPVDVGREISPDLQTAQIVTCRVASPAVKTKQGPRQPVEEGAKDLTDVVLQCWFPPYRGKKARLGVCFIPLGSSGGGRGCECMYLV